MEASIFVQRLTDTVYGPCDTEFVNDILSELIVVRGVIYATVTLSRLARDAKLYAYFCSRPTS